MDWVRNKIKYHLKGEVADSFHIKDESAEYKWAVDIFKSGFVKIYCPESPVVDIQTNDIKKVIEKLNEVVNLMGE